MTRPNIDNLRHFSKVMVNKKIVGKEFMWPNTELVNTTSIFYDLFYSIIFTNAIEIISPKITATKSDNLATQVISLTKEW